MGLQVKMWGFYGFPWFHFQGSERSLFQALRPRRGGLKRNFCEGKKASQHIALLGGSS